MIGHLHVSLANIWIEFCLSELWFGLESLCHLSWLSLLGNSVCLFVSEEGREFQGLIFRGSQSCSLEISNWTWQDRIVLTLLRSSEQSSIELAKHETLAVHWCSHLEG